MWRFSLLMLDQLSALWTNPALWFLGIGSEKAASTRDEAGGLHSLACHSKTQKASGILRAPFSCCGDTRAVDQLTTLEGISTHVENLEGRPGRLDKTYRYLGWLAGLSPVPLIAPV